jgi:hypothetical protein
MRIVGIVLLACVFGCSSAPAPREAGRDELTRTLSALHGFEGVQHPETSKQFPSDEHVARSLGKQFAQSRETALVALAWAGDTRALETIAKKLEPFFRDPGQEDQRNRLWVEGFQFFADDPDRRPDNPGFQWLMGALEFRRPDLARRLRQEVLLARKNDAPRPHPVTHDRREREQAAEEMRATPAETEPRLLGVLKDGKDPIGRQCAAAYGLATAGKAEGLAWLGEACLGNVGLGGEPALNLIESGEPGERLYLKLLQDHDGHDLPSVFAYSIEDCRDDLFWKHVERFVFLQDLTAQSAALRRIQSKPIPEVQFDRLVAIVDRSFGRSTNLVTAVVGSLSWFGASTPSLRSTASAWLDDLIVRDGPRFRAVIAEAFLKKRLGNPGAVAKAAREQLHGPINSPQPFDVLAEAGTVRDVAAIWRALQGVGDDPAYVLRSRGWLAICRLTATTAD